MTDFVAPLDLALAIRGTLMCLGFVIALFVLSLVLPGRWVDGQPLRDGSRKRYKLVGISLFVATHMAVFVAWRFLGWSPSVLIRDVWGLLVGAHVVTLIWLVWMYRRAPRDATTEGPATSGIAEFWFGRELNPELLGVDLKVFAYHPSLLGLLLLHWGFAFAQAEQFGALTPQMMLMQAFWWTYLLTHFIYEEGVLSMWDVIAEKFGFMLLWGDLVLVPFFYMIGGWTLMTQTRPVSWSWLLLLVGTFSLGLWIFRGSNAQKHQFKKHPEQPIWGRKPQTLGGRLLVSGFWGIGRKLNYSGEVLVYTSIAACAGFDSVLPYLLPLWLASLLLHRASRDEARCRAKYGALWDEYCKVAKFRMIPGIY